MKIHPVGAELFHSEGRTDMTKLSLFAILQMHQKTVNSDHTIFTSEHQLLPYTK